MILYVGFQTFDFRLGVERPVEGEPASSAYPPPDTESPTLGSNVEASDGKPFGPESDKAHAAAVAAGDPS